MGISAANIATLNKSNADNECIILNPDDWHEMLDFKEIVILLVVANELFDPKIMYFKSIKKQ